MQFGLQGDGQLRIVLRVLAYQLPPTVDAPTIPCPMNDEISHGETPFVKIQATCCLPLTRQRKRITQCIQRGPNSTRSCRKLNLTFSRRPVPSVSHLTRGLELERFTRYRKYRIR